MLCLRAVYYSVGNPIVGGYAKIPSSCLTSPTYSSAINPGTVFLHLQVCQICLRFKSEVTDIDISRQYYSSYFSILIYFVSIALNIIWHWYFWQYYLWFFLILIFFVIIMHDIILYLFVLLVLFLILSDIDIFC